MEQVKQCIIWGNFNNGEYNDCIIDNDANIFDENILTVKYYGQNTGRDDHYMCNNSIFVECNKTDNKKYKFIGRVIRIEQIETEKITKLYIYSNKKKNIYTKEMREYDIKIYKLTIQKENNENFNNREEVLKYFNLTGGNPQSGITRHLIIN